MNNRCRILAARAAGVVACLLAIDGAASAAPGTISMSWGTCSPIVSDVANPPTGPLGLIFSVVGNDETHSAYQVRFLIASSTGEIPDAWRFDAAGCGAGLLTVKHAPSPALAPSCPRFTGSGSWAIATEHFGALPEDPSILRGILMLQYDPVTADPGLRYFLAEFRFDHTYSVTGPTTPGVSCGGYETPLCFMFGSEPNSYLREVDGVEVHFPHGNEVVTVHSGGECLPPVPATHSTWGQIKSQYRR